MLNFKHYFLAISLLTLILTGCNGNVTDTIKQDFGLQERPEDYESGEERCMKSMRTVGLTELKRLNAETQHGEIKYQEGDALNGKFYKEVKRYTKSYPISANVLARSGNKKATGFNGTIEYAYEIYEGPRFSNRTKAEASDVEIPSGKRGREAYRYTFSANGTWDGGKGKKVAR